MLMNMGSMEDELEKELRTYGDRIRYDLRADEDLQDVNQLCKLGAALKVKLKKQANTHRAEINSIIDPSHGHQSLPT